MTLGLECFRASDRNVMTPDRVKKREMLVGDKWIEQSSISVVGLSPDKWDKENVCTSCVITMSYEA